jgi:DNA-binding NarL/FixJ family response regulator
VPHSATGDIRFSCMPTVQRGAIIAGVIKQEHITKRARILIVDDHQLVLQRVRTLLQSDFEIVGDARTGKEMVMEAIRLKPDVIVADIAMPEMSGIEAARKLRKGGFVTKLVFLTIYAEDQFIEACMTEGALGYVVKSHMKSDLIPAINAALSGRLFISAV